MRSAHTRWSLFNLSCGNTVHTEHIAKIFSTELGLDKCVPLCTRHPKTGMQDIFITAESSSCLFPLTLLPYPHTEATAALISVTPGSVLRSRTYEWKFCVLPSGFSSSVECLWYSSRQYHSCSFVLLVACCLDILNSVYPFIY